MLLLLHLLLFLWTGSSMTLDPVTGKKTGAQSKPPYEARCLYFDHDILVYDKPPNMLSVPGMYEKDSLALRVAASFRIDRHDQMIGG